MSSQLEILRRTLDPASQKNLKHLVDDLSLSVPNADVIAVDIVALSQAITMDLLSQVIGRTPIRTFNQEQK